MNAEDRLPKPGIYEVTFTETGARATYATHKQVHDAVIASQKDTGRYVFDYAGTIEVGSYGWARLPGDARVGTIATVRKVG